jgi:hypothetical protein
VGRWGCMHVFCLALSGHLKLHDALAVSFYADMQSELTV